MKRPTHEHSLPRAARVALLAAALAASVTGCTGRSLVGVRPAGEQEPGGCPPLHLDCGRLAEPWEDIPHGPGVGLPPQEPPRGACTDRPALDACVPVVLGPNIGSGLDPSQDAQGEFASALDCDPPRAVTVAGTPTLTDLNLHCANLHITLEPGSMLVLTGPRLNGTRLSVHAEQPALLNLVDATAHGALIELSGAARLQLDGGNHTDLGIVASPEMAGTVVALNDTRVLRLSAQLGPEADLQAYRTRLDDAVMEAGQILLDECPAIRTTLRAERVFVLASRLELSELRAGHIHASASLIDGSLLASSQSADLHVSTLTGGRLGPMAQGRLTLHGSTLVGMLVEAPLDSRASAITGSILAGPALHHQLSGGQLADSALCGTAGLTARDALLRCIQCDPAPPAYLCLTDTTVEAPECPGLEEQTCPDPDPDTDTDTETDTDAGS